MTAHKFKLGQRLRCTVTGFEGIATTRVEYLNGCVQYCVKPPCAEPKDGEPMKLPEGNYIDDAQLVLVDEGILDPPASEQKLSEASVGGPSHAEGNLPT